LNDSKVLSGKGSKIEFKVPEKVSGKYIIKASYQNQPYKMIDTTGQITESVVVLAIQEQPFRLRNATFSLGETYARSHLFQIWASQCGICNWDNRSTVDPSLISVSAVSSEGRNVLGNLILVPEGNEVKIEFILSQSMRIPTKRSVGVTIEVAIGTYRETFEVRILQNPK